MDFYESPILENNVESKDETIISPFCKILAWWFFESYRMQVGRVAQLVRARFLVDTISFNSHVLTYLPYKHGVLGSSPSSTNTFNNDNQQLVSHN